MKCPNCGEASRIREKNKYYRECGIPLKANAGKKSVDDNEFHSLFIDADAGVLIVNGKKIDANNVTALSLECRDGKYGLTIEKTEILKRNSR